MKNVNDKYVEYARVINMCNSTKFENEPWKCIKGYAFTNHPTFGNTSDLEFAVAILEDEPLFVGDKVYWKRDGRDFNWDVWSIPVDKWDYWVTRTPPKRTFMLNGVELPRPSKTGKVSFGFVSELICFESYSDAEQVSSAIKRILDDATKC